MENKIFCLNCTDNGMCNVNFKDTMNYKADKIRHTCAWERRHGNCDIDPDAEVV